MPYADLDNKHILYITAFGPANRPEKRRYKLAGMMRIEEPDGATYIQPVPSDSDQLIGIRFDSIEYVEPATHVRTGGDYDLTHYHADMVIGRRNV